MTKKVLKTKKAFTLIEILIATFIFAMVMVITTGVVAESVNYQSKLNAVRSTTDQTRKFVDLISESVREASGNFTINYSQSGTSMSKTYSDGIGFFICGNGSSCEQHIAYTQAIVESDPTQSYDTIVLVNKTKVEIYYYLASSNEIYYFEPSFTALNSSSNALNQIVKNTSSGVLLVGDSGANPPMKVALEAWGYSSDINDSNYTISGHLTQQPFLGIKITAETGNPSQPQDHAITTLRTIITARNDSD